MLRPVMFRLLSLELIWWSIKITFLVLKVILWTSKFTFLPPKKKNVYICGAIVDIVVFGAIVDIIFN
jgi:hypothetical protein